MNTANNDPNIPDIITSGKWDDLPAGTIVQTENGYGIKPIGGNDAQGAPGPVEVRLQDGQFVPVDSTHLECNNWKTRNFDVIKLPSDDEITGSLRSELLVKHARDYKGLETIHKEAELILGHMQGERNKLSALLGTEAEELKFPEYPEHSWSELPTGTIFLDKEDKMFIKTSKNEARAVKYYDGPNSEIDRTFGKSMNKDDKVGVVDFPEGANSAAA
ncbi:hypothetical protein HOF56_02815 [Candidatus Peribacteria bacterium]|jgi:hypothetical protein|nr:hypothetical protein [Candidatus Peribacteria bacterium]MBT4021094.1 hypothetical protein [Candidatus Peribacteria bacterium]MBT4240861.1 hypothetical protein [Candidatus Peribacteria bacterium]MBT4473757.1 hypothetical protein [Candidatus Peribacteria bacterium]